MRARTTISWTALALSVAALAAPARVGAVDVTVQGRIVRGDLSAVFPPAQMALPDVTLDGGVDQDVTVTLPFSVTDARGSGDGWRLTVTSDGVRQGGDPLPGSAARIAGVTAACAVGDPCTLPTDDVPYPLGVPVGPAPVRFFSAAAGTGLGTTLLEAALVLTLPANALAADYATTLTLAHAAGP